MPTAIGDSTQCLSCWEKCFVSPTTWTPILNAYKQIFKMVQAIRYPVTNKYQGTAYMLDSTSWQTSSLLSYQRLSSYQRNLGSIVALTQEVGNKCNPFFLNKYYRNFAWYNWAWPCKDKCSAAAQLHTNDVKSYLTGPANTLPYDWIRGGCILADHAMNNPGLPCSSNTHDKKDAVIAISNSKFRDQGNTPVPSPNCRQFNRIMIGTNPAASLAQMTTWASSGMAFQMPYNYYSWWASNRIVHCLNRSCCPNHPPSAFPRYRRDVAIDENLALPKDADEMLRHLNAEPLEKLNNDAVDESYAENEDRAVDASNAKQSFKYLNSKTQCSSSGKRGTCADAVKTFEGTFSQFEDMIKQEESGGDVISTKPVVPVKGFA